MLEVREKLPQGLKAYSPSHVKAFLWGFLKKKKKDAWLVKLTEAQVG